MHGGVRYLEKAVFNLDMSQLKLVFEALKERKQLLKNAEHLCSAVPILTVSGLQHHWLSWAPLTASVLCSPATTGGRCHTTGQVLR